MLLPDRGDRGATTLIGGFESTYLPGHGVDVAQTSGPLKALEAGPRRTTSAPACALPLPAALAPDRADPRRPRLGARRTRCWATCTTAAPSRSSTCCTTPAIRLADRRLPGPALRPRLRALREAVADRYPWLPAYTLVNEPFATLFLAGHEALWPPYDHGTAGLRATAGQRAARPEPGGRAPGGGRCRTRSTSGSTPAEHHAGTGRRSGRHAAVANDRRHVVLDLALGRAPRPATPRSCARWSRPAATPCSTCARYASTCSASTTTATPSGGTTSSGGYAPSPHPVGFAAVGRAVRAALRPAADAHARPTCAACRPTG